MEHLDIFVVEPPTVVVADDGIVVRTIAEYIDGDHERSPLGVVATSSLELATRKGRNAWTPVDHGRMVIGMVGDSTIFTRRIVDKQPWYRRSPDRQVRHAEQKATKAILSHLGLDS